jgi:hypothetical protein
MSVCYWYSQLKEHKLFLFYRGDISAYFPKFLKKKEGSEKMKSNNSNLSVFRKLLLQSKIPIAFCVHLPQQNQYSSDQLLFNMFDILNRFYTFSGIYSLFCQH